MKIAEFVGFLSLLVLVQNEGGFRFAERIKFVHGDSFIRHQADEGNVMFSGHRMWDGPNSHGDLNNALISDIAFENWDVLL